MATTDNYFDIVNILIYEVFGDYVIMYFVGLIALIFFCLRFNIPMQVTNMLFVIYTMLFFLIVPTALTKAVVILCILAILGFFYWVYARKIQS